MSRNLRLIAIACSLTLSSNRAFAAVPAVAALADPPAVATAVAADPTVTAQEGPTVRQLQWLGAALDQRIQLAEQLGEEGARTLARSKGWTALMDGTSSMLRQGLDQVYKSADGIVHVVEAKGGSSPLSDAYGYQQGSGEWAVKAAQRTLKSPVASEIEKQASRAVLKAASSGGLEVHVVRTRHVLGEPTAAVLEQTLKAGTGTTTLAGSVIDELAAVGIPVLDEASVTMGIARGVTKVALPVAVVLDAGSRINKGVQTERQFASGTLTQEQREIAHARNAAGMVGGWGGAIAGAQIGAGVGAAAGSCVAPGPGTAIGAGVGSVVGGVAGYKGGEAAAAAGAEWTVQKVHQTGTIVAAATSEAWNTTSHAAQKTVSSGSGIATAAWNNTKCAAHSTEEACQRGCSWVVSEARGRGEKK